MSIEFHGDSDGLIKPEIKKDSPTVDDSIHSLAEEIGRCVVENTVTASEFMRKADLFHQRVESIIDRTGELQGEGTERADSGDFKGALVKFNLAKIKLEEARNACLGLLESYEQDQSSVRSITVGEITRTKMTLSSIVKYHNSVVEIINLLLEKVEKAK